MFSQQFTIQNPTGLHARPAGQLVALCKAIPDDIRLITAKGPVNPKNILGILTAGLKKGSEITVEVEGGSEQQSGEKIIAFLSGLTE
ncbi:MAG: HPr family phosphocarrier protein [Eubacteriales bacterium]|nr:HPr family phosphocarrier protein [Eubacteriales bacterium]